MTNPNDGGPAFPRPDERGPYGEGIREGCDGMTLRDWFAGQALAGVMAYCGSHGIGWGCGDIASRAYEASDAMLAAREVKP